MWASTLRTEDVKSIEQSAKQWKTNALDRPWRHWELKGVSSLSGPFRSSDHLNPQDRRAGPSASSASHWFWNSGPPWAQISLRQCWELTRDRLRLMTVKQRPSQSKNLSLHFKVNVQKIGAWKWTGFSSIAHRVERDLLWWVSVAVTHRFLQMDYNSWSGHPAVKGGTNLLCLFHFHQQC